ncbi:YolD-like family protein [Lederbergia sp. NSJ-179]|uniref:YolD-like family protein n=1 Tax=Lederbergia sp. NSJ-179 TaxID=2931402 RepID=UPI001FD07083|nr:YolD-like family protein [Lederbergia sp. NSJ-179]MCJ7839388.1 YolD-like family protein [Lederbergia sp. NSJ-179]
MRPNKLTVGYNLRWESSRMMLPEHREQLLQEQRNQKVFQMPSLHEDQLQEINRILRVAIEQDRSITVTYAQKYGPVPFCGRIKKIDTKEGWLKIGNPEITRTIAFHSILQVEMS